MIDRQEILEFAGEVGLDPNVVEKDYVLGWMLAGIAQHPQTRDTWVFKGGTCLKKCYFETYRFSEDLDFTLLDASHVNEAALRSLFVEITEWIYSESGIEFPEDARLFEVYVNPSGKNSGHSRIGYRGPMRRPGDPPRVRFDLTDDERLVRGAERRHVHHPYSDQPEDGIEVLSYCFEEVFAEKLRALSERERPRDLYDVIHLHRHDADVNREVVLEILKSKCEFKGNDGSTNAYLLKDRAIEKFLETIEPNYNSALEKLASQKIDQECIYTIAGFVAYQKQQVQQPVEFFEKQP